MMTDSSDPKAIERARLGRLALWLALLLTAIFGSNVASGKFNNSVFMTDVAEALILFAASISFVIGVICMENAAKLKSDNDNGRNGNGQQEGTSSA